MLRDATLVNQLSSFSQNVIYALRRESVRWTPDLWSFQDHVPRVYAQNILEQSWPAGLLMLSPDLIRNCESWLRCGSLFPQEYSEIW